MANSVRRREMTRWRFAIIAPPVALFVYTPLLELALALAAYFPGVFHSGRSLLVTLIRLALYALIIPLVLAAAARLRNAGLRPWLVLPTVIYPVSQTYHAWLRFIDPDSFGSMDLWLAGIVSQVYSLGLILVLVILSPKNNATAPTSLV